MYQMMYEYIETLEMSPFEGIRSCGGTNLQCVNVGLHPEVKPMFFAYFIYSLEINIRASVILSYVGFGGYVKTLQNNIDMLVHYCFVEEAVPEEEKKYLAAVRLGGQGPDPFFYAGVNPFTRKKDSKEIAKFGNWMHHVDLTDVYYKMIEYAMKSQARDLLLAYIDGLLMHYTVDRTFHPYIFAESGFDEDGKLTGYYKWSHGAYEALLDVEIGRAKKHFMNRR